MNIIFYKATFGTLNDKIISLLTGGQFSHVELQFSDKNCFSASTREGYTRFKEIDLQQNWQIVPLPCDEAKETIIRNWCETQIGIPCDWWGIIGINLPILQNRNKWFCSELCCQALKLGEIIPNNVTNKISPNDLYRAVMIELT